MKTKLVVFVIGIIFSSIMSFGADNKADHKHAKEEHSQHLSLNNGKKWNTDATLKKNMAAMRKEFHVAHQMMSDTKKPTQTFNDLAATIKSATTDIVKNCKLDPKADTTLHVVLGKLLNAADELGHEKAAANAMKNVHTALNTYADYFDHPDEK